MNSSLTLPQHCKSNLEYIADLRSPEGTTVSLNEITAPLDSEVSRRLAQALAGMDPWRRYGFSSEALLRFMAPAEASNPRYVICVRDEIAGLAALKHAWMFGSYLNILAVLPQHQKCGIGSRFLDWFEKSARLRGERNQFVVTSAFNTGAVAFYRRHGFEPIANLDGLINDAETEILLRKRLAPTG